MSITIRFTLIAVIALTVGTAIAGCGGGSGGESNGSTGDASKEVSGTVEVWDLDYEALPEYTKAANRVDAEFEKLHPEVTVHRVAQPAGYEALYRAAFTAHEGPDVMQMQPGKSGVLSFKSGLEVINDRIGPDLKEHLTGWSSVTPSFTEEGGERYGVPFGLNGLVFYYNKKLFAKAGLPTTFEPKSWANIRGAAERLRAAGIEPFAAGDKEGIENTQWFAVGLEGASSLKKRLELGEGKIPFTDESVTKGLMPIVEFQEAGLFPSDLFSTPHTLEVYENFAEGDGAMTLGWWNSCCDASEFNPKLGEANVGFFFPPGPTALGATSNFVWSVPTFAKNKEAAWAWIEFQVSKRGLEIYDQLGGFMPNRDSVPLPTTNYPPQMREILAEVRERGTEMGTFGILPSSVAFETLPIEMNQVLQGRTSLPSAQEAMQEAVERTGE